MKMKSTTMVWLALFALATSSVSAALAETIKNAPAHKSAHKKCGNPAGAKKCNSCPSSTCHPKHPKKQPKKVEPKNILVKEYFRTAWLCDPEQKVKRLAIDCNVNVNIESTNIGFFKETVFFTVAGAEPNVRLFERQLVPCQNEFGKKVLELWEKLIEWLKHIKLPF